jgi:hypothetical protein
MVEDVGCTRQQQPERIRQEGGRRGAITAQLTLHCLNVVFAIATGTIEVFIEHLGCGSVKRRHDKTGVIPSTHDFRLQHHAPRLRPGLRRITELIIEPATGGRRLAMRLRQGYPLVMETTRRLHGRSPLAEQDGVTGEAKDEIGPAIGRDDIDDLGGSKMTIAADEDVRLGPVAPQIRVAGKMM